MAAALRQSPFVSVKGRVVYIFRQLAYRAWRILLFIITGNDVLVGLQTGFSYYYHYLDILLDSRCSILSFINPRRACTARVTLVVSQSVRLVSPLPDISLHGLSIASLTMYSASDKGRKCVGFSLKLLRSGVTV